MCDEADERGGDEDRHDGAGASGMCGHAFLHSESGSGTNEIARCCQEQPRSAQAAVHAQVAVHLFHRVAEVGAHRLRVEAQEMAVDAHQARFGAGANAARPRFTNDARRSSSAVAAAAPAGVSR